MPPPLIERSDELDRLDKISDDAVDGRGALVHIVGEAGIGKSSLLDAAESALRARRIPVVRVGVDEIDRRRHLAVLRRLVPDLAGGVADPVDSALSWVEQRSTASPLGLLIDDLQWADDASLDVIWALARRNTELGVVLVTTARLAAGPPGVRRLEVLAASDGHCLQPALLGIVGLSELARAWLGAEPGPMLSAALEGTAGNPFLASELLRAVADGDLVHSAAGARGRLGPNGAGTVDLAEETAVPGGLSGQLVRRTLEAVPDGDVIMRAVAAAPSGVTVDELAAVLDAPLGHLARIVLDAVTAGVLVDDGDTLAFRHDLLRKAVREDTPPSLLRGLSRRLADVLFERRADPERVVAAVLAADWAAGGEDRERIVAAARRFRPTHPDAAADLYELALTALPGSEPEAAELAVEFGWALVEAGRATRVEALLAERFGPYRVEEATDLARLRGISASLVGRLDEVAARYGDLDIDDLPAGYDILNAEVVDGLAEIGLLKIALGRMADAARIADWVEASPTDSSPFRLATVATVRAWLAVVAGSFEDGRELAVRALDAVAFDTSGRATAATPLLILAIALDQLGDPSGALSAARGEIRRAGPRWGPPMLQHLITLVLYRQGAWDDAMAEVEASMVASEENDLVMGLFWPAAVGALIASARDEPTSAREWLAQAGAFAGQPSLGGDWLAFAASVLAAADGDHAQAVSVAELIVGGIVAASAPAMLVSSGPELAWLARSAQRPDLVERIHGVLQEVKARTRSPVVAAVAAWLDGLRRGIGAEVAEAGEVLRQGGRRPEAARAFHQAAVLDAAAGDHRSAKRLAGEAAELYGYLGAEQWRRQLIAELRAVGVRVQPRRRRRPSSGWASLTSTEEAVVVLVGDGLTNTEVAKRLYVARRTVESHLRRIYTKLDMSSRPQLVAAVSRRSLPGTPGPPPAT
jgi:DNA-binding CsgD family transcriptional regulator/tetratricopeptide (TPR) repeat protein